eukprot:Sdes_comp18015_c0_seq3m7302
MAAKKSPLAFMKRIVQRYSTAARNEIPKVNPTKKKISSALIFGPTAIGKSRYALHAAGLLNAEIVNVDTGASVKYFDIGTAKPSVFEREKIPHHGLDVREGGSPFNVVKYCDQINQYVDDIAARGKFPLLVGGSSYYVYTLVEGRYNVPPISAEVKKKVAEMLALDGCWERR